MLSKRIDYEYRDFDYALTEKKYVIEHGDGKNLEYMDGAVAVNRRAGELTKQGQACKCERLFPFELTSKNRAVIQKVHDYYRDMYSFSLDGVLDAQTIADCRYYEKKIKATRLYDNEGPIIFLPAESILALQKEGANIQRCFDVVSDAKLEHGNNEDIDVLRKQVARGKSKVNKSEVNVDKILKSRVIRGVNFAGCDFKGKEIIVRRFENCNFTGASFDGATFKTNEFENCNFTNCTFKNTDFSFSDISGCTFKGSNFDKADLSFSELARCSMDDCSFKNAGVSHVKAGRSSFRYADFSGADLSGAFFNGMVDFYAANFSKADLSCTRMLFCDNVPVGNYGIRSINRCSDGEIHWDRHKSSEVKHQIGKPLRPQDAEGVERKAGEKPRPVKIEIEIASSSNKKERGRI